MKNYKTEFQKAKLLPTHVNGELQPIYKMYDNNISSFDVLYTEDCSPLSIFEAIKPRYNSAERMYITSIVTYRENGSIKPKRDWLRKLMYHKPYSRKDKEVLSVNFKIVGLKRETTKLPAGVLISNVKFII